MYQAYQTITGELEPKSGSEFLSCYYSYHGDWKNYAKTRNNSMSDIEEICVRRGCYYYLEFAYWCLNNIQTDDEYILSAISAKLIMNNDLSYVRDDVYCIWYPRSPSENTCIKLLKDYPYLKYQVARVCVTAKYNQLYKTIDVLTDGSLLKLCKEINPELYYNMNQDKLYSIFDDTRGILKEPEIFNEEINFFNTEVISNEEYNDSSDDNENTHSTNCSMIIDDLQVSDIHQEFVYYDPLRIGGINFKHVYEKINLFKKLSK